MRTGFAHIDSALAYQSYMRRLDAQAVLDHYGAENQRAESNGKDGTTEIIHSCLLDRVEPHHAHGDSNPSAACNLDKKLYVCYSYWGGSLLHLIMKMEGKEVVDGEIPDDVVEPFLGDRLLDADEWTAQLKANWDRPAGNYAYPLDPPTYSERILAPWAFIHPYLASGESIPLQQADYISAGMSAPTASRSRTSGGAIWWAGRRVPSRTAPASGRERFPHIPSTRTTPASPRARLSTVRRGGRRTHLQQLRDRGRVTVLGDQGRGAGRSRGWWPPSVPR